MSGENQTNPVAADNCPESNPQPSLPTTVTVNGKHTLDSDATESEKVYQSADGSKVGLNLLIGDKHKNSIKNLLKVAAAATNLQSGDGMTENGPTAGAKINDHAKSEDGGKTGADDVIGVVDECGLMNGDLKDQDTNALDEEDPKTNNETSDDGADTSDAIGGAIDEYFSNFDDPWIDPSAAADPLVDATPQHVNNHPDPIDEPNSNDADNLVPVSQIAELPNESSGNISVDLEENESFTTCNDGLNDTLTASFSDDLKKDDDDILDEDKLLLESDSENVIDGLDQENTKICSDYKGSDVCDEFGDALDENLISETGGMEFEREVENTTAENDSHVSSNCNDIEMADDRDPQNEKLSGDRICMDNEIQNSVHNHNETEMDVDNTTQRGEVDESYQMESEIALDNEKMNNIEIEQECEQMDEINLDTTIVDNGDSAKNEQLTVDSTEQKCDADKEISPISNACDNILPASTSYSDFNEERVRLHISPDKSSPDETFDGLTDNLAFEGSRKCSETPLKENSPSLDAYSESKMDDLALELSENENDIKSSEDDRLFMDTESENDAQLSEGLCENRESCTDLKIVDVLGDHVEEDHGLSDTVVSDTVCDNRVLGDEVIGDEVIGDEVISDNVLSDKIVDGEVICEKFLGDKVFESSILGDKVCNDKVEGQVLGDKVLSDKLYENKVGDSLGDADIVDNVVGDKVLSDQVYENEVVGDSLGDTDLGDTVLGDKVEENQVVGDNLEDEVLDKKFLDCEDVDDDIECDVSGEDFEVIDEVENLEGDMDVSDEYHIVDEVEKTDESNIDISDKVLDEDENADEGNNDTSDKVIDDENADEENINISVDKVIDHDDGGISKVSDNEQVGNMDAVRDVDKVVCDDAGENSNDIDTGVETNENMDNEDEDAEHSIDQREDNELHDSESNIVNNDSKLTDLEAKNCTDESQNGSNITYTNNSKVTVNETSEMTENSSNSQTPENVTAILTENVDTFKVTENDTLETVSGIEISAINEKGDNLTDVNTDDNCANIDIVREQGDCLTDIVPENNITTKTDMSLRNVDNITNEDITNDTITDDVIKDNCNVSEKIDSNSITDNVRTVLDNITDRVDGTIPIPTNESLFDKTVCETTLSTDRSEDITDDVVVKSVSNIVESCVKISEASPKLHTNNHSTNIIVAPVAKIDSKLFDDSDDDDDSEKLLIDEKFLSDQTSADVNNTKDSMDIDQTAEDNLLKADGVADNLLKADDSMDSCSNVIDLCRDSVERDVVMHDSAESNSSVKSAKKSVMEMILAENHNSKNDVPNDTANHNEDSQSDNHKDNSSDATTDIKIEELSNCSSLKRKQRDSTEIDSENSIDNSQCTKKTKIFLPNDTAVVNKTVKSECEKSNKTAISKSESKKSTSESKKSTSESKKSTNKNIKSESEKSSESKDVGLAKSETESTNSKDSDILNKTRLSSLLNRLEQRVGPVADDSETDSSKDFDVNSKKKRDSTKTKAEQIITKDVSPHKTHSEPDKKKDKKSKKRGRTKGSKNSSKNVTPTKKVCTESNNIASNKTMTNNTTVNNSHSLRSTGNENRTPVKQVSSAVPKTPPKTTSRDIGVGTSKLTITTEKELVEKMKSKLTYILRPQCRTLVDSFTKKMKQLETSLEVEKAANLKLQKEIVEMKKLISLEKSARVKAEKALLEKALNKRHVTTQTLMADAPRAAAPYTVVPSASAPRPSYNTTKKVQSSQPQVLTAYVPSGMGGGQIKQIVSIAPSTLANIRPPATYVIANNTTVKNILDASRNNAVQQQTTVKNILEASRSNNVVQQQQHTVIEQQQSTTSSLQSPPPNTTLPVKSKTVKIIDLTSDDSGSNITLIPTNRVPIVQSSSQSTQNTIPISPSNSSRIIITPLNTTNLQSAGITPGSNFIIRGANINKNNLTSLFNNTTKVAQTQSVNTVASAPTSAIVIPDVAKPVQLVQNNTPKHPAPPPDLPSQKTFIDNKALPSKPVLNLARANNGTGIVLSWTLVITDKHAEISTYTIYAYQETTSPPSNTLWKKVGSVKAMPLPMACTLTQFQEGHKYHFSVQAVDMYQRVGPFSEASTITLLAEI